MGLIKIFARGINGVVEMCNKEVILNCNEEVSSVTPGYVTRTVCCGGQIKYQMQLTPSVPTDANDVAGVIITKEDGTNFFATGVTVEEVTDACNTCCGTTGALADNAMPAFTEPSASTAKCLTTTGDNGSQSFVNKLALEYYGRYDVMKGISRFATNKFTFFSTDAVANIVVSAGHSVANGACA